MAAPMVTFVVLLLCLEALSSEGQQFSEMRIPQAKSCEKEDGIKGQVGNELEGSKMPQNGVDDGKTRLWKSRYLLSELKDENEREARKSSYILDESLRQKWLKQVRQQKRVEALPEIIQRAEHNLEPEMPTYPTKSLESRPQQTQRRQSNIKGQEDASRNDFPRLKERVVYTEPSEVISFGNWSRHHNDASTEPSKSKTETVHKDDSLISKGYRINPDLKHITASTIRPNLKGFNNDRDKTMFDVPTRRRQSQVTFLTQSTMIYPFITPTQAFNYLTSYDSIPVPKRWPIKMILPGSEQKVPQEIKSATIKNEHEFVRPRQSDSPGPGGNEHSKSLLEPNRQHENQNNAQSLDISSRPDVNSGQDVDSGQEDETSHNSRHINSRQDVKIVDSYSSQQVQTTNRTNENTQDAKLVLNSGKSLENQADKSREEKRRKRLNQQLRKQNKKLKKQRKRRKQKRREMEITLTSIISAKHEPTFPSGSAEANLASTSNLQSTPVTREPPSLITQVGHGRTTTGTFLGSTGKDVSATLTHSHGDGYLSDKTGVSILDSIHPLMYRDRVDYSNGYSASPIDVDATQPSQQLLKTSAHKTISKTQPDRNNDKSNKFSDKFPNRKNNDKHMSTSRPSDSSTPPIVAPISKNKFPNCKEKEDSRENCSEDITNDSPDNTEHNLQQHLQDRTHSGPNRRQASASHKDRSDRQVIRKKTDRKTTDTYRSKGELSPLLETEVTPQKSREKTTNAQGTSTNVPIKTSSVYTYTTPLQMSHTRTHLSDLSPARQWRDRIKQKQAQSQKVPKEHTSTTNVKSDGSEPNVRAEKKRGSLASAFSTPSHSKKTTSDSNNGYQGNDENGPFIGYKSAFDFLSNQKGVKTNSQNEARREANELNRFMAEGMCQIFGKHYVPTRIGGKCE